MNSNLLTIAGPKFTAWQMSVVFDQGRHGKPNDDNRDVWEPVRQRQAQLLSAVAAGPRTLATYLRDALGIGDGDIAVPAFPRPALTAEEFRSPPAELERELRDAWTGISRRLASKPVHWLLCHVAWIEQGRFGRRGDDLTKAFVIGRKEGPEAQTRNLLRRTGGIPHERGKTSVFSDCPLARSWWRCFLSEQVAHATDGKISRDFAHEVLRVNHQAWERLAMLSVKRIVVINHPIARAAVVSRLSQHLSRTGKLGPADVQDVAVEIARMGLRRSLEHTLWEDLT